MLTFAKAKIVDAKKGLKAWCEENDFDYTRMSKLINKSRLYVATEDEKEALSRWLDIPKEKLFADAWEVLQAEIDRPKKSRAGRGSTRSRGAG